jgi:hypothetical protein
LYHHARRIVTGKFQDAQRTPAGLLTRRLADLLAF